MYINSVVKFNCYQTSNIIIYQITSCRLDLNIWSSSVEEKNEFRIYVDILTMETLSKHEYHLLVSSFIH